ncbi:TPA: DUF3883 domain-containing protein [Pseudomonas aeruginosa]
MNAPENGVRPAPSQELFDILDAELDTAATAERRDQKVYHSLQRLSQLIGGEYGDRVVYELLQNAHDAQKDTPGQIAIHLVVSAPDYGQLYVANGGAGFDLENLQAIRNIANSTKDIGEGIGNKGVGFRSVEALTDDPHVFSCRGKAEPRERFDGYCFRLASQDEVEHRLVRLGHSDVAASVAATMPRYLAAIPVEDHPDEIDEFAREGYATVVALPLRSPETVALAIRQIEELVDSEAPVLLFLDRIASLEVRVKGVGHLKPCIRLTRQVAELPGGVVSALPVRFELVTLGPSRQRWLLVRHTVSKANVVDAVERSIVLEPGLKRWINWRGDAIVSVAVPIEGPGLQKGRLFNFLPMGADAQAPFFGHLDAPFFTSINRERARLDLPLNAYFLSAAAEICATAAQVLSGMLKDVPSRCAVDLVAWRSNDAAKLIAGFQASGVNISKAEVWPTTAGGWKTIRSVQSWPTGDFKVFTWSRATKAGAQDILSTKLGADRLTAIENLARALGHTCTPSKHIMAGWAEAIARSLPHSSKEDKWGDFYAELAYTFRQEGLLLLRGKDILLDRDLVLVAASEDVYVRQDGARRRRTEGAPLPPATLARKLTILADTIKLKPETVSHFERAGLWRRYDATEILERLPTLFGNKPAGARREAALLWAFEVWRHDGPAARRALEKADLHVPTRSGWMPARKASFSQAWTEAGHDLDSYLAEARSHCEDCESAALALLVDVAAWPKTIGDRQEWLRFLKDAGVVDGLIAIPVAMSEKPIWGSHVQFALCGTKDPAMDLVWWSNCGFSSVAHPYTNYWRQGEAFKLPGQSVVHALSDETRRRFAALVVRHLQQFGHAHLTFELLRKDRDPKHQDKHTLRTPISTFLSTAAWFPMESAGGYTFVPLAEGWLITDRRMQLKFVPRATEEIQALLREGAAADLLSTAPFRLRFWRDKTTAADRLDVLASVCNEVSQHERPHLRRHYDEAWQDLLELGQLPHGEHLIVERSTGFECLAGANPAVPIYLRTERTTDLAKLLIDTGAAVLVSSGERPIEPLIQAINSIGGFYARSVDEADIRLLTDGEPFRSSLADPLLVDIVPWLAEALVLGHELGARSIEKSANVGSVLERLRRLRLRQLSSIELASGTGTAKRLNRYLHRDEECPTLLVVGRLNVAMLGDSASIIAPFVHPNLRTFELLLVRLAFRLPENIALTSFKPTEADYAHAVQADVDAVREHLTAYRHDDGRKVELLTPLVAYYAGVEIARALTQKLSNAGFTQWASILGNYLSKEVVQNLLTAIEKTEDLAVLRRNLDLEYARFNHILVELGRGSLASESELRRLFDLWRNELRPELRDRLRRHFAPLFNDPAAFMLYTEWRSLELLIFDESWIATHETLTREDVQLYAKRIFGDAFGEDPGGELSELETLRSNNRKTVISAAQRAKAVLQAAAPGQLAPEWSEGPAEIAAALDRKGFLDFHAVDEAEILVLLIRAGLWPEGVAQSLDLGTHGLSVDDLDRVKSRAAAQQAEEKVRRNRIEFAGHKFDASDDDFASQFASTAHATFAESSWRERSSLRLTDLAIQPEFSSGGFRGAGGKGTSRLPPRPPEAVRAAIGLAGELLAFRYLERKHRDHFSEQCWVSENRKSLFPEDGDLTLGYDFRVNTREREWLYEVKATPNEACEFELTDNEYRVAISAAADRSRRYRILFIQHVFDPERCQILELPNPAAEDGKFRFRIVGRSSVRMRFDLG